ncbi:unnamed protein product [Rotaria sordida]|uniref:Reverse transcriptase domain-containing protein n=1 Tax=Rotaria sordida TaxID=392033 RepID=A0A819BQV4_9BILA|nr:unnamed protein product [Rotaria sordida]CAF3857235.1 unnamed protein product [Rotaria sordida]
MRKDKNLNGNNDDKILLNLSKYPSVLITKPNKGRGVVILDRNDYTEKLENILSDNKKFKLLNEDPTISCENALTTVLRQMKNEEYWTQQEYKYIKPVGSVPARLYGLPKVHKDNVPLRPIVSCIKSYNYKLGKFLANIIKPIRVSPYSLKHTNDFFKFIQQNSHLSRNNKMISFDIQSLFTNIPVRETIEIICNKLYCTDPKLRPFIPEDYFRKLLEFAATELCHVYYDLIKIKTQRRSNGPNKMRLHHEAFSSFNKDHKFLSILSIIPRSYVLSSLEADLQEIQQKSK